MEKIEEGTRLSKRDLQKVHDLYQIIELKPSKEELTNKVDKKELR